MSSPDPRLHSLYTRLEEILGAQHADTLMTYLPPDPAAGLATKSDVAALGARFDERFAHFDERFARLEDRFDRLEDRFDRMEDRFHTIRDAMHEQMKTYTVTTVGAMTALTAMFSFIVTVLT